MASSTSALFKMESLISGIDANDTTTSNTMHATRKQSPETVRAFDYRNQLIVAAQFVLSNLGTAPIAIVLGSGLGGFGSKLQDVEEMPYSKIPFLPEPTVKGHSGKIMMGYLDNGKTRKRIMCFSGRLHCYEGYPMYQVTFCARLAYLCGVHSLILTNAAGGCIPNQEAGSVVIMTDYVRDVSFNVLRHSANDQMFGVRHMKANKLLDEDITQTLIQSAKDTKFPNYKGTYWWCNGPCYETSAQVRFSIRTGAQSVGMSTVPSILAAKNIGLRVAAMSLCTNVAAGLADEDLNHAIVCENAALAAVGFSKFVSDALLKIEDPKDYKQSKFDDLKLNLSKLSMNIDSSCFDEHIFPRKYMGTYDELYRDITFVRNFMSNVLDLNVNIFDHDSNGKNEMQSVKEMSASFGNRQKFTQNIKNRDGPIPIWILHDPFSFNAATLECPISIPLKTLKGFEAVSTSASARNAILNFGFDQKYNLIVVIVGVRLEGFSFDECNFLINLMYGVLGHKNLYFTNMFYAFPTKTMYSEDEKDDENDKNSVKRGEFALIKDIVDFKGGFPRFPRPLFPPKETNVSDCYVRMKYGVFGNTKTTDSQIECLKGFKGFFDSLSTNKNEKTQIYSYAFWPGPQFPSCAELNISDIAGCELTAITNPCMTPMCRQLGFDGYSVAYVGTRNEFDAITSSKGQQIKMKSPKDVTSIVFDVSSSMISFFKSSACLYSPASMNRSKKNIFAASTITDKRLKTELFELNVPFKVPQFQILHSVANEWSLINEAADCLKNVWNFGKNPICNALFSSFANVELNSCKIAKAGLVSIKLSSIPGWKEHFCGGYPYSHYHWNNDNPFDWTLKIVANDSNYYIVIAPQFFNNTQLHPKRYSYLTSFYKYTPRFWNLSFIIRVLWKLGVENVCFLSHLIANNCSKSKEAQSLDKNSVVLVDNYIEGARWSILSGPNDERLGPRFTPITEPIELKKEFAKIAQSDAFKKQIPDVMTVHIPSSATISKTTSAFYGSLGYETRVSGLVPCIQTAQHLGLQKVCVGIVDYTIEQKLKNVDSFNQIVDMIQVLFKQMKPRKN